jgi:hypothetical protein
MKLKLFIIAMCLGMALPVTADVVTTGEVYEVALSDLRLPSSESGTIAFKECSACAYMTKRVGADTRWLVNGRAVSLEKFSEAINRVTDRDHQVIGVLHHLEKDRVTQVSVYL